MDWLLSIIICYSSKLHPKKGDIIICSKRKPSKLFTTNWTFSIILSTIYMIFSILHVYCLKKVQNAASLFKWRSATKWCRTKTKTASSAQVPTSSMSTHSITQKRAPVAALNLPYEPFLFRRREKYFMVLVSISQLSFRFWKST